MTLNNSASSARENARHGDGKFGEQQRTEAEANLTPPGSGIVHASQHGHGAEALGQAMLQVERDAGIGTTIRVSPADEWAVAATPGAGLGKPIIAGGIIRVGSRHDQIPGHPIATGRAGEPFDDGLTADIQDRYDTGSPFLIQRVPVRYDDGTPDGWAVYTQGLPDTDSIDDNLVTAKEALRAELNSGVATDLQYWALTDLRDSADNYLDELDRTGLLDEEYGDEPTWHAQLRDAVVDAGDALEESNIHVRRDRLAELTDVLDRMGRAGALG